MKRVKNTKSRKPKLDERYYRMIEQTNVLNLAIWYRVLHACNYKPKTMRKFTRNYLILLEEIADGRNTVDGFIEGTKLICDIDTRKILCDAVDDLRELMNIKQNRKNN